VHGLLFCFAFIAFAPSQRTVEAGEHLHLALVFVFDVFAPCVVFQPSSGNTLQAAWLHCKPLRMARTVLRLGVADLHFVLLCRVPCAGCQVVCSTRDVQSYAWKLLRVAAPIM
jgi:hypothetical protein